MSSRIPLCSLLLLAALSFLSYSESRRDYLKKHLRRAADEDEEMATIEKPWIKYMHIYSDIDTRFASTLMTCKVANMHPNQSKEVAFTVQLPNSAFISNFSMYMHKSRKLIVGTVKEKEQAKADYDRAVSRGQSAGHVAQKSPRETNSFQISVNVEALDKVTFNLTYQEILSRVQTVYKHIVNIEPHQIVRDFKIHVSIRDQSRIVSLRVPKFGVGAGEKTNKELLNSQDELLAKIDRSGDQKEASITFAPSVDMQRQQSIEGLRGQFVVLYDVERKFGPGEIQVVNGYFVHFFAPSIAEAGSKHVIFVLDKSGSMQGRKMDQTKAAMEVILRDLKPKDYFNILAFSDAAEFWKPESVLVSQSSIEEAIRYVQTIEAMGGTNINDALQQALRLLARYQQRTLTSTVIFLTDGQATVGQTNSDTIISNVVQENQVPPQVEDEKAQRSKISIHSIAFGDDADFELLKKISLRNNGLARKIYEDSDSALQLQGFYDEVSVPLLTGLQIRYLNESIEPSSITSSSDINNYYEGSEFLVTGRILNEDVEKVSADISAYGVNGRQEFVLECILPPPVPQVEQPLLPASSIGGFVERMWAYLTIKKLLEQSKYNATGTQAEDMRKKALSLSLKYNFVTELTSMVVVQKDGDDALTNATETPIHLQDEVDSFEMQAAAPRAHSLQGPPGYPGYAAPSFNVHSAGGAIQLQSADDEGEFEAVESVTQYTESEAEVMLTTASSEGVEEEQQSGDNPTCESNQEYTDCGNPCEQKCGEDAPDMCMAMCAPPGCYCANGFVRDPTSKACVEPSQCPMSCPANERLNGCGNLCELRCTDVSSGRGSRPCPRICNPPACVCVDGFARHSNGTCVPTDACPAPQPECPQNEHMNQCGNLCELQCDDVEAGRTERACVKICNPPACECIANFARHRNGTCIPTTSCVVTPKSEGLKCRPCDDASCEVLTADGCEKCKCRTSQVVCRPLAESCGLDEGCFEARNVHGCPACFCKSKQAFLRLSRFNVSQADSSKSSPVCFDVPLDRNADFGEDGKSLLLLNIPNSDFDVRAKLGLLETRTQSVFYINKLIIRHGESALTMDVSNGGKHKHGRRNVVADELTIAHFKMHFKWDTKLMCACDEVSHYKIFGGRLGSSLERFVGPDALSDSGLLGKLYALSKQATIVGSIGSRRKAKFVVSKSDDGAQGVWFPVHADRHADCYVVRVQQQDLLNYGVERFVLEDE